MIILIHHQICNFPLPEIGYPKFLVFIILNSLFGVSTIPNDMTVLKFTSHKSAILVITPLTNHDLWGTRCAISIVDPPTQGTTKVQLDNAETAGKELTEGHCTCDNMHPWNLRWMYIYIYYNTISLNIALFMSLLMSMYLYVCLCMRMDMCAFLCVF